jgi:hypothetical protein
MTKKPYLKMRPNELHNALNKRNIPLEEKEMIKDTITQTKKAQLSEKMMRSQHRRLWSELLSPLKYELGNARVGLNHQGRFLPERQIAFTAYIKVMEKALSLFDSYQLLRDEDDKPMTPATIAREKDVPNNGVHWTDWIPQSKKTEVALLFDAIPHAPKTKRKVPFQRIQRPNTRLKNRLLTRTIKELGNEESEQAITPTDERAKRIEEMKEAITLIRTLKPSDAVPHTWHGLQDMG